MTIAIATSGPAGLPAMRSFARWMATLTCPSVLRIAIPQYAHAAEIASISVQANRYFEKRFTT